jgi:hypothetical protein
VEQIVAEDVPGPPDAVRGFYVEVENIKLVHPRVVSVRTVVEAKRRTVTCRSAG